MIISPSKPAHSDFQHTGKGKNFTMKSVLWKSNEGTEDLVYIVIKTHRPFTLMVMGLVSTILKSKAYYLDSKYTSSSNCSCL